MVLSSVTSITSSLKGDSQYYMDTIFKAAKKVGLDLGTYGGGLEDGKYVGNKDGGKIAVSAGTAQNSNCPMKPGRAVNPNYRRSQWQNHSFLL